MVTTGLDRIANVAITPVAFRDPPLLNAVGVHEPYAIRAIVEITTDGGATGLGETYGDRRHLARLRQAAATLVGTSVWHLNELTARVATDSAGDAADGGHGMSGMVTTTSTTDRLLAPFEVACLDLQGKLTGRPVSDLLGGPVRDRVDFSGYLFYKWAGEDDWGAAADPAGIVAQARRMVADYGFRALKLKGGVHPPEQEIATVHALRAAFPDLPLRIDPNGAWSVDTAVRVGTELAGVLEYLEDPTLGVDCMAEVASRVELPLATNMCVVAFDQLKAAVARDAVQVVLSDLHFWGGLRRSLALAQICDTFGLGLSMHSNSHLGISLAAMTHLGAATPNLTYACDTHWPWKDPAEDVIVPGVLSFADGAVAVPSGPGLGVELDRDALARLHEQYLSCGITERDDTGYYRRWHPDFDPTPPRW